MDNNNDIGVFYTKELNKNKKILNQRRAELEKLMESSEDIYNKDLEDILDSKGQHIEVFMSAERLDSALNSYLYDMIRYKSFHGMLDKGKETKLNFQKIYSFVAKWIIREKPFYLEIKSDELVRKNKKAYTEILYIANVINEKLIIDWIVVSYKSHFNKDLKFSAKERKDLYYSMKYRDFSTGIFELLLNEKIK